MTEFELRERMFEYMETSQSIVLAIQKEWNHKLKVGVPIDPAARYELMSNEFKTRIEIDELYFDEESYVWVYIDTLINEENPFQTICVYVFSISDGYETKSEEVFMIGEEDKLLKRMDEFEVSK